MKKQCVLCKKLYTPDSQYGKRFEESKYCSKKCKTKAWGKWGSGKRQCKICKTKFIAIKNRKYCSDECIKKNNSIKNTIKNKRRHVGKLLSLKRTAFKKLEDGKVKFGKNILTLKNYKEPLTEIPKDKGYGWYGTLACELDGGGIQCHQCGEIKKSLPGHISGYHKMKIKDYKIKFGLSMSSALISEKVRMKLKYQTLEWFKGLTPEQKEEVKHNAFNARKLRTRFQPKKSLEQKNKEGTCPDQLLQKIKDVKEKLGHTPSLSEFMEETGGQRFKHLIFSTFGSWVKALNLIGTHVNSDKVGLGNKGRYSREYLLEMLNLYAQENRKIPTESDCKRGLIPSINPYVREFGSLENARQEAGVYEFIDEETLKRFKIKSHVKHLTY